MLRELKRQRFILLIALVISLIFNFTYIQQTEKYIRLTNEIIENYKESFKAETRIEPIEKDKMVDLKAIIEPQIFEVTAYCSCAICCGKSDGITASGVKAKANKTIAMDAVYPMGTKVMIEGFDGIVFEKQDVGGKIKGNKIDIYMDSHNEALKFGRKILNVWIL